MAEQIQTSLISCHRFSNLSGIDGLVHGVFTRHGGVSQPPYATLNVAWNNGDRPEAVQENLRRVKQSVGMGMLVSTCQVHGDIIRLVDSEAISRAKVRDPVLIMQSGDALVTSLRGVGLLIKTADCQAVFLVDPMKGVIANIHCGWRGSVADLPAKVVSFLKGRFGCNPKDLYAAISPSLGPCCAEFRNFQKELPRSFLPFQSRPLHFDFWRITRSQLTNAGVPPVNIETAERCTVCETDRFFSYRREGNTGRNAAVIGWAE